MIGLVTGASSEREYVKYGIGRRFITVDVTDHTGKVELVLFDDFADRVTEYLKAKAHTRPVVVVQLASVSEIVSDFL
ncbi:hypothetical protein SESBI_48796 [Sesbania bispinosa]|nr:hypothetical protein SESBI_48796 [Sesbania bispinosa]